MKKMSDQNFVSRYDLVAVRATELAGRGVFALQNIEKGLVIERTVSVSILSREKWILEATSLWEYYFVARPEINCPYICGYVVFGLSSICNHAHSPNADLAWMKEEDGVWVELHAKRDIEAGEEVTIYYQNIEEYVAYGNISRREAYGISDVSILAS